MAHCHECVYAFPLRAGDLSVHHRLRVRPRFGFRVKNARQVLSLARLIVDDPAFGRADVKRSFRAVNNSGGRRFLSEYRWADGTEREGRENAYFAFHVSNDDYSVVFFPLQAACLRLDFCR